MEDDLVLALKTIESSLAQLSQIPEQFNRGARNTAQQIAGVITAVQAHDITGSRLSMCSGRLKSFYLRFLATMRRTGQVCRSLTRGSAYRLLNCA